MSLIKFINLRDKSSPPNSKLVLSQKEGQREALGKAYTVLTETSLGSYQLPSVFCWFSLKVVWISKYIRFVNHNYYFGNGIIQRTEVHDIVNTVTPCCATYLLFLDKLNFNKIPSFSLKDPPKVFGSNERDMSVIIIPTELQSNSSILLHAHCTKDVRN